MYCIFISEYLSYYYYLHQILIHRDGIIDKEDNDKVKELKIELPEYEKGAKILVDQKLFISVTRLILRYIDFNEKNIHKFYNKF